MANKYYDSAATGETTPYESVATAANDLTTANGAISASNEIIWANSTSNETIGATTTYTASATYALPEKPQRLYSVSDFDASPSTLASGATINGSTGANGIIFVGNWDIYGFTLQPGSGGAAGTVTFGSTAGSGTIYFRNGNLALTRNATSIYIKLGPVFGSSLNDSYKTIVENTSFSCANAASGFQIGAGEHTISGLTLTGSTTPTTLFYSVATQGLGNSALKVKNSDLTGKAWTNFADLSAASSKTDIYVENCLTPVGINWVTGTISQHNSITIINSGSSDIGYQYAKYNYSGSIITTGSVYAASNPMVGAGSVSISDLFTSGTTCGSGAPLTREYLVPVADNATVTPYVELLVQGDGASALNTDDIYIEAEAITVAGSTQGTKVTSHPGLITAGSACSAGTISYTGDGYTTERTHKLTTSSITAAQQGFIKITVCLAKPSTAIYVGQVGAS